MIKEEDKVVEEDLTPEEIEILDELCLKAARSLGKLEEQIAKEREKELTTEELIEQAKLANSLGEKLGNGVLVTPNKVEDEDDE